MQNPTQRQIRQTCNNRQGCARGGFARWLRFALCACCFVGAAVFADDGELLLRKFWSQTPGARAEFRQRVYDSDGELLSSGGGKLWFARGGKFRVEYQSPEELLLVSNGETFWSYEKDLQQVLVRPLSSLGGGFLAALSAGEWKELPRHYILAADGADDNLHWESAKSRDPEDAIRRIRFGFDGGGSLRQLQMHDAFGGVVQITMRNLTIGAADGIFVFVPPPGAEVISDR